MKRRIAKKKRRRRRRRRKRTRTLHFIIENAGRTIDPSSRVLSKAVAVATHPRINRVPTRQD
jgi:hypothetical protein